MTLRQNKVAIRLGNFVFHGDDYGVIIKRDETIIGDVYTFLSLSSGDIVMLREHRSTPYTRRENERHQQNKCLTNNVRLSAYWFV